ncbi:MAG: hypothetical protein ACRCSN_16260, partial [Dermatophilaceae bacterium]
MPEVPAHPFGERVTVERTHATRGYDTVRWRERAGATASGDREGATAARPNGDGTAASCEHGPVSEEQKQTENRGRPTTEEFR